MAYDPEARQTGNNAMIASIVALVLIVGAVLAYYATRRDPAATETNTTIVRDRVVPAQNSAPVVVQQPAVAVPVPATNQAPVVIDRRPIVVQGGNTRTIVRDSKTTTTKVVPAPQTGGTSGSGTSGSNATSPNVTINNNPPAAASPSPSGASGTTSNSASSSDSGTGTSSTDLPPPAPATP